MFSKRLVDKEIEILQSSDFTAENCAELADLLIVKKFLLKDIPSGETPLLKAAEGKDLENVFEILEKTMAAIKKLQPRLYENTLNQIKDL